MIDDTYPDHTALAEFYLHDWDRTISRPELDKLAESSSFLAKSSAASVYSKQVVLVVRAQRNGFIEWITAFGVLAAFLHQYPQIKIGAKELCSDAKLFGNRIQEQLVKAKVLVTRNRITTRRRRKTPGLMLDLLEEVDWLQGHHNTISDQERRARFATLNLRHTRLLREIQDNEAKDLLHKRLIKNEIWEWVLKSEKELDQIERPARLYEERAVDSILVSDRSMIQEPDPDDIAEYIVETEDR